MAQSNLYAGPRCYCEIYPHEGGVYAIPQGQVINVKTRKHIGEPAGTFTITLAPGGPNGANVGPSWLDIITPMSFVKIGMVRGQYQNIVMLGVVTNMSEGWAFGDRENVVRNVTVTGADFGYFFTHFSWFALTFLNGPAAAIGVQLGSAAAGNLAGLGGSLTSGTPDEVGAAFYQQVMDGGNGILSKTWVQNGQNNKTLFNQIVSVLFEKYIEAVKIFFTFTFINAEENWYDKFGKIFPWPFYEFFINTAPSGFYAQAPSTSWNTVNDGQDISMLRMSGTSRVYVIARVNPLPMVPATVSGNTATFGTVDVKAWNNLPLFTEDSSLIRTVEQFTEAEVRNFYLISPIYQKTMLGEKNDAVSPPLFALSAAVDPASVHRYGFRPAFIETEWLADLSGQIAQTGEVQLGTIIANMTARMAGYYEPVSLMMRAQRTGTLRPDIIPGCRFQYQPLKDKVASPWMFYIDCVEHDFTFGGPSITSVGLSRGLPASVYGDTGLLTAIHMGNAQRANGVYQQGLPSGPDGNAEQGLEAVSLLDPNIQQILGQIAPIYSTPGAK